MRCEIHDIEIGYLGCAICAEEERRQQKRHDKEQRQLQERHEEELYEARQLRELQEQMLVEQQFAEEERLREAGEARRLAKQKLEIERARAKADQEHREREELRAQLRAGLPEFPPSDREDWRRLSEEWETAQVDRSKYLSKGEELQKELKQIARDLERSSSNLHKAVLPQLEAAVNRGDLGLSLAEFPDCRQAFENNLQELKTALERAEKAVGGTSSASRSSYASADEMASTLLTRIEGIKKRLSAFDAEKLKSRPGRGCGMAILAGVVLLIVLSAFDLAARALDTDTFWIILLGVFLYFILGPISRRFKAKPAYSAANNLAIGLNDLAREGNVEVRGLDSLPESSKNVQGLAKISTGNLDRSTDSVKKMLTHVFAWQTPDRLPLHSQFLLLRKSLDEKTEEVEAWMSEDAPKEEAFKKLALQYHSTRDEIRKIGRQIVEGIRVPGKAVHLVECPACGANVTSEISECSYCDTKLVW